MWCLLDNSCSKAKTLYFWYSEKYYLKNEKVHQKNENMAF